MARISIKQHEPLRVPQGWREQERGLVIQLNRILDEVYGLLGTIQQKIDAIQAEIDELQPEEEEET